MKKILLGVTGGVLAVVLIAYAVINNSTSAQDKLMQTVLKNLPLNPHEDLFNNDSLNVILCGTGSPLPSAERAGPCTAIVAGGKMYLVDVGASSVENLNLWRLPNAQLSGILITHFHSDHIAEIGEAAMFSWAGGRPSPLQIYGPEGIVQVAKGFSDAYGLDNVYRTAHHGADLLNPEMQKWQINSFAIPQGQSQTLVADIDGLKITAIRVDHRPIDPAVAYRFDYKGRSVVISGDTVKSDNLQQASQGVDILIHEALAKHLVSQISDAMKNAGNKRMTRITHDILDYHTSPVEAAEIARDAEVKMLVFSHIVPPLINPVIENMFMRGVDEVYQGPLHIGTDGMVFTLPANSDAIIESTM